jgi:hypothetical protein
MQDNNITSTDMVTFASQCIFYFLVLPMMIRIVLLFCSMAKVTLWPRIQYRIGAFLFYTKLAYVALKTLFMFKVRKWFDAKTTDNVKLINRNTLEVSYKFRDAEYRIRSRVRRGPKAPITILANGKDVTEELLPYIGPGDDFHGITYSPQDFGYSTVTVQVEGREDLVFDEFDTIAIPQ